MTEYISKQDAISTMRRLFDMRHGIAKEYVELYADMIELCGNCKYCKRESIDSGWVCVNPKSMNYTDCAMIGGWCFNWEAEESEEE